LPPQQITVLGTEAAEGSALKQWNKLLLATPAEAASRMITGFAGQPTNLEIELLLGDHQPAE
jgi:hypothetical protein